MQLKVLPNPRLTHDANYAQVTLDGADCPFLTTAKLCSIQSELGEGYLSRTCDTYPRAFNIVDDMLQRSLYLSCPEAARLILFRPDGIQFADIEIGKATPHGEFPIINIGDNLTHGKPYVQFRLIHEFAIQLLQNRAYHVLERMIILEMYCDQISRVHTDELEAAAPILTESFAGHISTREFDSLFNGIVPSPMLLLNVVIGSLEDRIATDYTSPRFLECYRHFIERIGFVAGIDTPSLADNFEAAKEEFYDSFMADRDYIWENYLVAKAHKDLFPFGPQKGVYHVTRTIYQEFILLATPYIFARTLLVGQIAGKKKEFAEADIVKSIQSFARATDHNAPYLSKILLSIELGKIAPNANIGDVD
jgi:lysine-N-methylase